MKRKILLMGFVLFTFPFIVLHAQPYVTLQHNGNASFYTSVTSAYSAATNKDTIIIPGGNFKIDTLIISKRLVIYGTGHYPDSSTAMTRTVLEGHIYLKTGADSGMIQGFYLTGDVRFGKDSASQQVNGYIISRVNIQGLHLGYKQPTTSSGILISESVIRGSVHGYNAANVLIEKCILDSELRFLKNTIFNNNFFHFIGGSYWGYGALFWEGIDYCTFNNNMIRQTNTYGYLFTCSNCVFNNNAFETSGSLPSGTNSGTGNLFNLNFGTHLVTYSSYSTFSFSNNYHLTSSSSLIGKGTDSFDIGIYGTQFPYKAGGIPENPHFMKIVIPSQNDASGKLNVQIKVRAEER